MALSSQHPIPCRQQILQEQPWRTGSQVRLRPLELLLLLLLEHPLRMDFPSLELLLLLLLELLLLSLLEHLLRMG
jgi:hypothetical protein